MEDKQFKEVTSKLDTVIKILAAGFVADKSKTDAMVQLANCGLSNTEIAKLVDSTSNTVHVAVYRAKHGKKAKKE